MAQEMLYLLFEKIPTAIRPTMQLLKGAFTRPDGTD
jgi:hypothetical protein